LSTPGGGSMLQRAEAETRERVPMKSPHLATVMPALVAGIHVFLAAA
jgi:hypothetical protein